MFSRVVVVGAGAIGSSFGVLLSRNSSVLLVGRKNHVGEIKKRGLKLSGAVKGTYRLQAVSVLKKIPENSLVIVSAKATTNMEIAAQLKGKVKRDTIVVVLQNGFGVENAFRRALERKCLVLRAVTTAGAFMEKPGAVVVSGINKTFIEPSGHSRKIAALFNEAKIKTEIPGDFKRVIWFKLIMNCVFNPLTALAEKRNNVVVEMPKLVEAIVSECVDVAKAEGLSFSKKALSKKLLKSSAESTNYSSMLQDIWKGRETEIEFLNGQIVSLGKKHGINCPLNSALVELIKAKEKATAG